MRIEKASLDTSSKVDVIDIGDYIKTDKISITSKYYMLMDK